MKNLEEARKEIDDIDGRLVPLLKRRLEIAGDVLRAKIEKGLPILDPAREREVMARVAEEIGSGMEDEARLVFTTLFAISRARQRSALPDRCALGTEIADAVAAAGGKAFPSRATVACPGTEGSYSQQALCAMVKFPSILYFKGFEDVFMAVEKGMCDYGVLPIENSKAGSVTAVYDLMARHSFRIVRATRLRIHHVLLAPKGVQISDLREITSHPHALAQCANFLAAHPGIRCVPASNTAAAAKELASSGRRDSAVIASRECAVLYGLEPIAEEVSDTTSNFTRFICISKRGEIYPKANKMSLLMSLGHRPGALADVLVRFAAVGVNLTKLESRPVEGSDFEFRFIFELEASVNDERTVRLLTGLANDPDIEHFTFLGAYEE
ncbi:MAG: chorismate mutase [Kiritimatiellae bacterium]|nr:chorismate mutase [Kiritimatiellia bacterium]